MKQKLLTLLFAAALIAAITTAAFADTGLAARQVETEYYPDGSYAVIETTVEQHSGMALFATAKTKSASRTYTY